VGEQVSPIGAAEVSPRRKPWVCVGLEKSVVEGRKRFGGRASFAPTGLNTGERRVTHGLRRGLRSSAATRLCCLAVRECCLAVRECCLAVRECCLVTRPRRLGAWFCSVPPLGLAWSQTAFFIRHPRLLLRLCFYQRLTSRRAVMPAFERRDDRSQELVHLLGGEPDVALRPHQLVETNGGE